MKVYLDDVRPTPEGWVRCFWPEEVIALLQTGQVTEVSLDHDLGDAEKAITEKRREITGKLVLEWIEEQLVLHGRTPPIMRVHSDNGPGILSMIAAIKSIRRRAGQDE